METPPKTIDAVRLVRRIRNRHHDELKGLSRADRIAFFNGKVSPRQTDTEPAKKTES